MTKVRNNFRFAQMDYNPAYESGIVQIKTGDSLRACLKHNKSENFDCENLIITREPKWLTLLKCDEIDTNTGEIEDGFYFTDNFKAANNRKIKALTKFTEHYQPLYTKRQVSMMLHTFTAANTANMPFKDVLDSVKYRYAEIMEKPVKGYIWTLEVSEKLHMHYHLCVATDRFTVKKIPDALKFHDIWGKHTEIEFVKKNVRNYLAKYFAKHNARVKGFRSYGKSSKFD